ncbi:SMI1/KNR4 family protein [Thalassoglobus sp. JC818]|uniref:SMI1/KNR4 family protein n=1 Tax=Thalassoglobus sp. JC818 TaxID=3232136 RepID=UPI00345908C8
MGNIRINSSKAPSIQSIEAVEIYFATELPDSYRKFIMQHDGARPETCVFRADNGEIATGVNQFIPIKDVLGERSNVASILSRSFPIADDGCGNYVTMDIDSSRVDFWDHESNLIKTVAETFTDFLNGLVPFKVKLHPGQVKRVWIDPAFLEELEAIKKKEQ